ncbi:MAG: 4-(cytidine 5'-diphospho)-2-C-methyl-D-erythritol kinase [Fuerstiella sp.]|nr:4-(cytidine 5'-diphospho)-2-C-methyl-D-erythritol kinase [Fuerstiella sp.]MCP4856062.1 4-(cytidine 5'-diphospho)-2-C-methyl-D-erythritol kinase [Fuerstiella sp.]
MNPQLPARIAPEPGVATASALQLRSPAKINVFLEVHGARGDGFHELETVMLRTGLHDVLRFEATSSEEVTLQLADYSLPSLADGFPLDDSNLILRAAHALRDHTQTRQGAAISVHKRIPAEAGLAGGSSNAATTLLGLNQLWGLKLPKQTLHDIAASLGSDVNFFVEDCPAAVCSGRGERVALIQPSGCFHFVAVRPTSGNSTPEVFGRLNIPCIAERRNVGDTVAAVQSGCMGTLQEVAFNRLTLAATDLNPQMAELMSLMRQMTDRTVFMSGSGSTCFVIARNAREAGRLKARLQHLPCQWLAAFKME